MTEGKLARRSISWNLLSFLIGFTVTFLLVDWVVWAAAHAWHVSLITTSLITLVITLFLFRRHFGMIKGPWLVEEPIKNEPVPQEEISESQRKRRDFDRISRERAEVHKQKIGEVRERRAREIKELEQELGQYKNIPSDPNEEAHE